MNNPYNNNNNKNINNNNINNSNNSNINNNNNNFRITSKLLRPNSPPPPAPTALNEDVLRKTLSQVEDFVSRCGGSNLLLVTGAGVSVDSGIPDYRGHKGSYYENHKPITHDEYVGDEKSLKRYWARSLVGYER